MLTAHYDGIRVWTRLCVEYISFTSKTFLPFWVWAFGILAWTMRVKHVASCSFVSNAHLGRWWIVVGFDLCSFQVAEYPVAVVEL